MLCYLVGFWSWCVLGGFCFDFDLVVWNVSVVFVVVWLVGVGCFGFWWFCAVSFCSYWLTWVLRCIVLELDVRFVFLAVVLVVFRRAWVGCVGGFGVPSWWFLLCDVRMWIWFAYVSLLAVLGIWRDRVL